MFGYQAQYPPQLPYGCIGTCEGSVVASGVPVVNIAMAALAGLIGTWGIIEQIKLQQRMLKLAERASAKADEYRALSQAKYNTVDLPTWVRMRTLFDRYRSKAALENKFINCAFALKEFCPDYGVEGRTAKARVAKFFAHANNQRQRIQGINCRSAACHHTSYIAAMSVLAQASNASAAYQYVEERKRDLDSFYWQRWQDGANFVMSLGDAGVKAIIAGAANVNTGLQNIGQAVGAYQQASQGLGSAIASQSQFWGGVSSQAFGGLGQAVGSGYFNQQSAQPLGSWTTTVSPSVGGSVGGGGSFKD